MVILFSYFHSLYGCYLCEHCHCNVVFQSSYAYMYVVTIILFLVYIVGLGLKATDAKSSNLTYIK